MWFKEGIIPLNIQLIQGLIPGARGINIANNVAGHQNSAIVPLLAGTYMLRAHDSSGQVSMPSFINSTGASLQSLQLDSSVQEDPDFLGSMNRMSNVDDVLKIESEDELDSISNFDNITRFDALNGIWNTSSSGYDISKPQCILLPILWTWDQSKQPV